MGASAVELIARYRDGSLRPSEAVERCRDRWRARQEVVGAFTATRWERALAEAARADREYRRNAPSGPLAGVPVAVKDLIDSAECATEYGSPLFAGHRPGRDAEVVGALRRAGAIVVGKTVTHEFAWGITSLSEHGSRCRNPLDPERIAGGSSGGSAAAVADGQAAVAIGTDTAGSSRIPAMFCGVSGFKPSFGAIATHGCWPLAPSLDHVGVIAADPRDAALVGSVLRGAPLRDAAPLGGGDGVPAPGPIRAALAPEAPALAREALAAAGIEVRDGSPLETGAATRALATIQAFEALAVHRAAGLYPARRDRYGADVRGRLERAEAVSEPGYREALAAREALRGRLGAAFAGAELLVAAMPPIDPPRVAEMAAPGADSRLREALIPACALPSLLGLPACVVPLPTDRRFPPALQVIGRRGSDRLVLETAATISHPSSAP